MTTYKVIRSGFYTYIQEFWDDLHIYTWKIKKPYYGGDLRLFLEENSAYRTVHFDNLNEFHRRSFILNL